MKIGVKTYADKEYSNYFKDKVDFLEIMAIPEKDYSFLDNYPLPIVVHVMHSGFGINPADSSLREKNLFSVKFAIELADRFGSEKIILHPGVLKNENCSLKNSIEFFKGLDERIIFENMSFRDEFLCSSVSESKNFASLSGRDFCFDINHAMLAEMLNNEEMFSEVEGYLGMNPIYYHLGGQRERETHLCFKDSTIPLKNILDLLPDDSEIALEVTTDIKKTADDVELIKGLVR